MTDEPQAAVLTRELRYSDEPLFQRLRELLASSGIDVHRAVLAQLFPDDVDQEFGVLLAGAGRVFTFVLHYGRRGDLKTQARTSVLASWTDISEHWEASPYRKYVLEALPLIDVG
jgi:hypothetical protein